MIELRKIRNKPLPFLYHGLIFVASNLSALFIWSSWSFLAYHPQPIPTATSCTRSNIVPSSNPPTPTFYDEPDFSYSIEKTVKDWDEKREVWLEQPLLLSKGREERIFVLSGSQLSPCKYPVADNLFLRFYKNKADYCRIHGYDFFYNNAVLHPKMVSVWVKLPLLRSAMLAHPEAEWILWIDADAVITDMEFKIPLERYKDYNFVVDGYADLLYKEKKWMSVNAGVFLIRNCQWSMDFLDAWASMGPQTPEYQNWTKIHLEIFKDMRFPYADEQSALAYLMLQGKETWMKKIYLGTDYSFNGYWELLIGSFNNITNKEWEASTLRKRHAEVDTARYTTVSARPFITHFAGCSICSSKFPRFEGDTSLEEMERTLNFADNQVLRSFGYMRRDISDPNSVMPLPFSYSAEI